MNMTCDSFKSDDEQEVDTIKDIKPGFVFKCRGLLYPLVKYEDGTVHRVYNGELVDLPETLPVAKIVCSSFGDSIEIFALLFCALQGDTIHMEIAIDFTITLTMQEMQ